MHVRLALHLPTRALRAAGGYHDLVRPSQAKGTNNNQPAASQQPGVFAAGLHYNGE